MNIFSKRTALKVLLACTMMVGMFTACDDDFTEEDALKEQQTIDLSIYVVDFFNTKPVDSASVSIVQDGVTVAAATNEKGVATFGDVKIGGNIPVTITKDGFTEVTRLVSVNTGNYRQGQITQTVNVLSLTESTATIKGRLTIETNLTNDEVEVVPAGTVVRAVLEEGVVNNINTIMFTATTDENGYYELTVRGRCCHCAKRACYVCHCASTCQRAHSNHKQRYYQ